MHKKIGFYFVDYESDNYIDVGKLKEEAREVFDAFIHCDRENFKEELADVLQITLNIIYKNDISLEELAMINEYKQKQRGKKIGKLILKVDDKYKE